MLQRRPWQSWKSKGTVDLETGRASKEALEDQLIGPRLELARASGVDREALSEAIESATEESGDVLASTLSGDTPGMLRLHRAVARSSRRRMRAIWADAFDAFYAIYVGVEEMGSNIQTLRAAGDDRLDDAVLAPHARACLVMPEIHGLITLGYPHGAVARTRTLYETAVIGLVLEGHGRTPGCEKMAELYFEHAIFDQAKDLRLLRDGGDSDAAEHLLEIEDTLRSLKGEHGRIFARDYGWAYPVFPSRDRDKSSVHFSELDDLVRERGLQRLDYRAGNHHVHSSAWSVYLHGYERRGRTVRLTGPTNIGFVDPARIALLAVLLITTALIHSSEGDPDPIHLATVNALEKLADDTLLLFEEAEATIRDRAERFSTGQLSSDS